MMKNVNFGEWLRMEVTRSGKTMAWMAREVGASQSLLSRWRQGAIPRTEYFLKVCSVLATTQGKPINGIIQQGARSMGIDIDVN